MKDEEFEAIFMKIMSLLDGKTYGESMRILMACEAELNLMVGLETMGDDEYD